MSAARPPAVSWQKTFNMSCGFVGIQFGWALQMANMSAIYEYLGAGAHEIPLLWLAAPLTGLLVQPVIGYMSDRTWNRLGRRRPYFLTGALLAAAALAGSALGASRSGPRAGRAGAFRRAVAWGLVAAAALATSAALAPAFDMDGGFNDVSIALASDAVAADAIAQVDRVLEPYGGLGAVHVFAPGPQWLRGAPRQL